MTSGTTAVPVFLGGHLGDGKCGETGRLVACDFFRSISMLSGWPTRGVIPPRAELFRQNCASMSQPGTKGRTWSARLSIRVGAVAALRFPYSAAMKRSEIVWTPDQLGLLKAPRKHVPGVRMMFPGWLTRKTARTSSHSSQTLAGTSPSPKRPCRKNALSPTRSMSGLQPFISRQRHACLRIHLSLNLSQRSGIHRGAQRHCSAAVGTATPPWEEVYALDRFEGFIT